jgi:hypothetical protein
MNWSILFVCCMVQYCLGHEMTLTTQQCVLISCCLRQATRALYNFSLFLAFFVPLPVNLYPSVLCVCLGYGMRNSFLYSAVAEGIYVF